MPIREIYFHFLDISLLPMASQIHLLNIILALLHYKTYLNYNIWARTGKTFRFQIRLCQPLRFSNEFYDWSASTCIQKSPPSPLFDNLYSRHQYKLIEMTLIILLNIISYNSHSFPLGAKISVPVLTLNTTDKFRFSRVEVSSQGIMNRSTMKRKTSSY